MKQIIPIMSIIVEFACCSVVCVCFLWGFWLPLKVQKHAASAWVYVPSPCDWLYPSVKCFGLLIKRFQDLPCSHSRALKHALKTLGLMGTIQYTNHDLWPQLTNNLNCVGSEICCTVHLYIYYNTYAILALKYTLLRILFLMEAINRTKSFNVYGHNYKYVWHWRQCHGQSRWCRCYKTFFVSVHPASNALILKLYHIPTSAHLYKAIRAHHIIIHDLSKVKPLLWSQNKFR